MPAEPTLPPAMVEAAARAIAESRIEQVSPNRTDGSQWASPPVPDSLAEAWREVFRNAARAALAAALSVCEVREQWCVQLGDESGTWLRAFTDRRFAESWIRRNNEGELVRVVRFATPPTAPEESDRRGERRHVDDDRLGHDTAGQDGPDVPQRLAADLLQRDGDGAHGADSTTGADHG